MEQRHFVAVAMKETSNIERRTLNAVKVWTFDIRHSSFDISHRSSPTNRSSCSPEAITHLDGQHLTQVIEGKAVAVFKSYRLAAAARWLLACAQGRLQAVIADFNRAKDALIKHSHRRPRAPSAPPMRRFNPIRGRPGEIETGSRGPAPRPNHPGSIEARGERKGRQQ